MKPRVDLSKEEVLATMSRTRSNKQAARYLGISYNIWKREASKYQDLETGQTLFQKHINPSGLGIPKKFKRDENITDIKLLFTGEIDHREFPPEKLRELLIYHGHALEECDVCGFKEKRDKDGKMPLLLNYKNGNSNKFTARNVHIVCYNCAFIWGNEVFDEHDLDKIEGLVPMGDKDKEKYFNLTPEEEESFSEINEHIYDKDDDDDLSDIIARDI